uniref:palmitoyl-CoA hydrolase n=1 Tax=Knipowitschia caucasica TaxID=637954 RepID=A0AAV2MFH9_KNICA
MSPLLFLQVFLQVLLLLVSSSEAYKPVIIVHGLFDGPDDFINLTDFIQETHPGTNVTTLDMYDYWKSLTPLWTQVEGLRSLLEAKLNQSEEGAHLICFSQGGVICRALLSVIPNHNIHTFIALSSPLAGQFGDPHNRDLYLEKDDFLPLINGETQHKDLPEWKKNFLQIKKMVLIGGPDDGVITPWQSSLFGFYNKKREVVEMKNQEVSPALYICVFFPSPSSAMAIAAC